MNSFDVQLLSLGKNTVAGRDDEARDNLWDQVILINANRENTDG